MIDFIFSNEWSNVNDIIFYLNDNNIESFNQGFFTKVFLIDGYVLKINCGDIDYGFKEYIKFIITHPSIHAPVIMNYKEINGHYIMLTELLTPMISKVEPLSVTYLRELIKENLYEDKKDFESIREKFESMLEVDEIKQISEIFNFFKDFNNSEFSIDICLINIMLRGTTWVINDPLVKMQPN